MKNILLLILLLTGLQSFSQSTAYKGDTLILQTKTDEGYFLKYMISGEVLKTYTSPTRVIENQTAESRFREISGATSSFDYSMMNEKEATLSKYIREGWKVTGKSYYQEASSYTLQKGDVMKGNLCTIILSFMGDKLEGKSQNCL